MSIVIGKVDIHEKEEQKNGDLLLAATQTKDMEVQNFPVKRQTWRRNCWECKS